MDGIDEGEERKDSELFEKDESEGDEGKVEEKEKDEETHGQRIEMREGLVAEKFVQRRHGGQGQRTRTQTPLQRIDDEQFHLKSNER